MTFVANYFELPDADASLNEERNPCRPVDRRAAQPAHFDERSRKAVCVTDLGLYRREESN